MSEFGHSSKVMRPAQDWPTSQGQVKKPSPDHDRRLNSCYNSVLYPLKPQAR
jgi:hypothetical protein